MLTLGPISKVPGRFGMPWRATLSRLRAGVDAATLTSTFTRCDSSSKARVPSRSDFRKVPR